MIDKRGLISTGMTWVVATIIIIVVIFIFLLASISLSGSKGDFELKDRYRDFGVSKSTSVFLDSNWDNVEISVRNNDYEELEKRILGLLDLLDVGGPGSGGWNLKLYVDDDKKLNEGNRIFSPPKLIGINTYDYFHTNFEIGGISDPVRAEFWQSCEGGYCK
tara:strand:+ start:289 stop:774 length:486 start_codon:yes stop_codon:yes gene_type:complete